MKIKLDENIGRRGVALLQEAGHDVMTVFEQNLSGAAKKSLFALICLKLDHIVCEQ